MRSTTLITCATTALLSTAGAITVDFTSQSSIRNAASTVAYDMMTFYSGNQSGIYNIPGMLPASPAYYWWEAGAMWNTLIDYWFFTGDTSYNDVTSQGLLFQVGPYQDYMPPNQSKQLGNDDQGFWGMAAMTAAEYKFPNPPSTQPQWLALAQAVFNEYVLRWDKTSCGGGLKWQIFNFNTGYDYKNAIANGCLFNLAARLARYTGNSTYTAWADKAWDWTDNIGLIDDSYNIFDGTDDSPTANGIYQNCSVINHLQYSYNPGVWILGAANMYNTTTGATQDIWKTRTHGIFNQAISTFADSGTGIFVEMACETQVPITCNTDMLTFKGILLRNLAAASKLAPFLATDPITSDAAGKTFSEVLHTQASAAAKQCSGGNNGRMCGFKWASEGTWDGTTGAGQQMSALEALINTMISTVQAPVTNSTGGTSVGNTNAGNTGKGATSLATPVVVTTKDRAGAGILTAVWLSSVIGGVWWMCKSDKG